MKMVVLMAVLMWYNSSARRMSENLLVMIFHFQTVNPFKLLHVLSQIKSNMYMCLCNISKSDLHASIFALIMQFQGGRCG